MRELFSALEPCERVLWQEDTAARDELEQRRNRECGFADTSLYRIVDPPGNA